MIAASLQGQTLGKYRILEPLGRGGMARVYRAYHPQLNRYVAVKVLRSDLVEEGEFLARFQREAQAVAALRHTNIIQVFDFDVENDVYFIVMELLEGDTLKVRLTDYRVRGEQMPPGEIVRVLLDVLAGLAYAHAEGMIHRDIKPANVLLTKRGQAVLADFGIAQIVGGTQYTVAGALMGTLNYMAPEQGLTADCDARSDIYSLGIVFYEMLTRTTPFDADTPLAILMKHLNEPLPLLHEIDPTIPQPFERVVLKSLAKSPDERYRSAGEMAQALQEAAQEAGIEIPARISLPLSFTMPDEPDESVAVFSGTARRNLADDAFAADDTNIGPAEMFGTEYETPQPALAEGENEAVRPAVNGGELSWDGVAKTVFESIRQMISPSDAEPARRGTDVVKQLGQDVWTLSTREFSCVSDDEPPPRGKTGKAIFHAISFFAIFNLFMALVAGLTNNYAKFFGSGWAWELLLLAACLCIIMRASHAIWLLVPVGILMGFGIFFGYLGTSYNWFLMQALWPLLPLTVIGAVWATVRLSGQGVKTRWLAYSIGGFLRGVAVLLIFLMGIVISIT